MSLTNSPSSLLITCPYHLNLASLTFSAISTSLDFFLISSSYMSLKYSFLIVHLNFSDPLYFNVTKQVFVDSVLECAHLCQAEETCEAFKHRNTHDDVNCQITEGEPEVSTMLENDGTEKWTLYTLETVESVRNQYQISCHQYSKDLRIALNFFILSTYVRSMHPILLYQTLKLFSGFHGRDQLYRLK